MARAYQRGETVFAAMLSHATWRRGFGYASRFDRTKPLTAHVAHDLIRNEGCDTMDVALWWGVPEHFVYNLLRQVTA